MVGQGIYLHMMPWEGAFVTLFDTGSPEHPYAVVLQVEEVIEAPAPFDLFTFYRPEERAFIRLSVRYLDAASDVAALIDRLTAELDHWKPSTENR